MGYVEEIYERAAQLGGEVDKPLAEARAYLSRADELNKQLEAARKAEETEYAKHVETAAATGKLPALNGWGRWIYDSPASKLIVAAVPLCHSKASAAAREAGPRIFEALRARVAVVVAESAKLAATVPPGVVDEATALRAGKAHAALRRGRGCASWSTTGRVFRVARGMQRAGWVDGPSHPRDRDGAVVFQRYLRPLSLPPGTGRVRASCGWRRPRRPTPSPACTRGPTRWNASSASTGGSATTARCRSSRCTTVGECDRRGTLAGDGLRVRPAGGLTWTASCITGG